MDKYVLPSSGYPWPAAAKAYPLHVLSEQTGPIVLVSLSFGGPQQSVEQPDCQFELPESVLWLLLSAN